MSFDEGMADAGLMKRTPSVWSLQKPVAIAIVAPFHAPGGTTVRARRECALATESRNPGLK